MLEKLFGFDPSKMTLRKEVIGGITTFLTMAYILAVNPSILSATGMDAGAVFTTTCISAVVATLVMALYAKLPFALAPGMGLNAFFAFTVVLTMGYSWQFALTAVLIEGLIFILLTVTGLRQHIVNAIPLVMRRAISPGIGLADGIFDIVSSGSTLVSNNLREVEVVMQSEALLIGNKQLSEEKRQILEQMLFRFKAVKDAEDKKYVRMNAPKARLQEIIDVLPGLKSPTIIPLADDEWCSVHTVLDQKQFWEIIGKLKEMGAQGILVTPIEKMIL